MKLNPLVIDRRGALCCHHYYNTPSLFGTEAKKKIRKFSDRDHENVKYTARHLNPSAVVVAVATDPTAKFIFANSPIVCIANFSQPFAHQTTAH